MEETQPVAAPPSPEKSNPGKLRRVFKRILIWTNYTAILFLLISYLSPFISPRIFWPIAFFGMAYPVLLLVNLLFVIWWLIRWKMKAFYSLAAILLGLPVLMGYVQFNFHAVPGDAVKAKNKLKLMSFNTKLFDLYNWSHNLETRNKIFDLLKSESADIICMQEFYNSDKPPFRNLDTLVKFQKAKYCHSEYMVTLRGTDHWGMATFSSYPIVNKGMIGFNAPGNNSCIYTDIQIDSDTIRVYNVHLQSMHFSYADYKFMDQFLSSTDIDELQGSRTILRRLKWAFRKRAGQADIIENSIRSCPYPVIISGDFNDTPASYAYHVLHTGMEDAFRESGNGFGQTYYGKFPSFRIDYILHSPAILAWNFQTVITDLSDHYPISCTIALAPKK